MTYLIEWHPNAKKFLMKLPKNTGSRILKKFSIIAEEPFRYLEHYEGQNFYKLRIGDYRALIDVDFNKWVLKVQVLGHRKNVYERLK